MTAHSPRPVSAFTDDALGDLDAVGLAEALRVGEVSIPEVVDAAIARIEAVDPKLNAVVHRAYDAARAEAVSPRGGFFAGVPTMLKDNVEVAGLPNTHGTDAYVARPPARHGDLARHLLATGLIPVGITRMSEFGFSAAAEHERLGAVRNPWDTNHTAGASSAGSGVLVAAGALPIAHGNDGGGSVRIPASCNGLVGLKPTRARLAQDKMIREMPIRIVSDGVLTRSVRDTAAFYREAERIWRNPKLSPIGDVTGPAHRRLRVAMITRSADREVAAGVIDEVHRTARLLTDLGHRVEEIDTADYAHFPEDFLLYWSVLAVFLLRAGKHSFGPTYDPSRTDNLTRGLDRHWRRNAHRFPAALLRLRRSTTMAAQFHREYDVVLSPTLGEATPRVGWLDPRQDYETLIARLRDWVAFTPLANATGQPSISLPLGMAAGADGQALPLGMMFTADLGDERTLLELAYELEEAQPFARVSEAPTSR